MATPSCAKCDSHSFERGRVTPLGEQQAVAVLLCSGCGAVVGTLDSSVSLERLQKQMTAIDEGLIRIARALSEL